METVVQKGSGKGLQIPGYRIGGKTGTAQKAHNGVYIPGARICSFVAVLPVENPRYVVLVVVDEPQGANAYGATVAVPVARQIVEALLVLQQIPPSAPVAAMAKPAPTL
jgi:cell division protein FtsI (penicillin-binding protein 3)